MLHIFRVEKRQSALITRVNLSTKRVKTDRLHGNSSHGSITDYYIFVVRQGRSNDTDRDAMVVGGSMNVTLHSVHCTHVCSI